MCRGTCRDMGKLPVTFPHSCFPHVSRCPRFAAFPFLSSDVSLCRQVGLHHCRRERVVSLWRLVDIKTQKKKKKKGDSSSEDESSSSSSSSSDSSSPASSRYARLLMGSFAFPHCSFTPILSFFSDENEEENEEEKEEGESSDDVEEVKGEEEEEVKDVKGQGKGKRAKKGKAAPQETEIKAEGSAQRHDKGKGKEEKEATKKKRHRKDKAEEEGEEEEKPTKKRKGKEEEGEEEKPKKEGKAVPVGKLCRFATVDPSKAGGARSVPAGGTRRERTVASAGHAHRIEKFTNKLGDLIGIKPAQVKQHYRVCLDTGSRSVCL